MRAFVAVELDDQIRKAVEKIQRQAAGRIADGTVRWVRPGNIHLTLAFLGEIGEETLVSLEARIREATGTPPFEVTLAEAGAFPSLRRPRIFWIGVADSSAALGTLAVDLQSRLRSSGFPVEERAYQPHLTLGRLDRRARPEDAAAAGEIWTTVGALVAGVVPVKEIVLIRSRLEPQGPTYTALERFPLRVTE